MNNNCNYLIEPDAELTTDKLGTMLAKFQTRELPKLRKYRNYYDGKQKIMSKQATDIGKPNNKVVANYCYNITQNYLGYIAGIPIGYEGDNIDEILDILNYNDVTNEDSELLRDALIYGKSYELCYCDEEGKQRFRTLDPRTCVPIYSNTLSNDLLYCVRFWKEDRISNLPVDDHYYVEVYGPATVRRYRSTAGFASFELLGEAPHYYGQCPITVFSLNSDETSVYDQVMTLQDAYNDLISGELDNFDAFADAYLVMKGVSADAEDLNNAKRARAFMIDNDADISYLTKNITDTAVEDMKKNLNDQIHKVANSPDLNDKDFMAQSGVAIRYKLVGFENASSAIESNMRKALQRRIELLSAVVAIANGESTWRDIKIVFTRNLPTDIADTVNIVNQLRGLVSDETLLRLLPFIDNVDAELKRISAQKEANMALYTMGAGEITNDDEEDDNNG